MTVNPKMLKGKSSKILAYTIKNIKTKNKRLFLWNPNFNCLINIIRNHNSQAAS